MTVKVLLVDDEALIRAGFRALLTSIPDFQVVGEAANGAEAVQAARTLRPDVALIDIRMPVMDGLEATRRIVQTSPDGTPRMLVVTTFDRDEYVFEALRAGASGFVLKDTPPEQLVEAIRIIAAGDALLSPTVTRRLITEFVTHVPPPTKADDSPTTLAALTDREREVLVQVATGKSNAELAAHLHMSPATAKTHVSNLLTKLGVRDRVQLVVIAYESGLITPGTS